MSDTLWNFAWKLFDISFLKLISKMYVESLLSKLSDIIKYSCRQENFQ